jgi:hypothetical protein
MRACLPASAVLALGFLGPGYAQEKARILCNEADPKNKCPGEDCLCAPDTLEVTFDGRSESVLDAGDLDPGATITVTVVNVRELEGNLVQVLHTASNLHLPVDLVTAQLALDPLPAAPGVRRSPSVAMDTRSDHLQGWSYGVTHDASILELVSVTTEGTAARTVFQESLIVAFDKVEQCLDPDPRCAHTKEGGGWISATLFPFAVVSELPIRRNSLAIARYTLLRPPGRESFIQFSDRLRRVGSPPVSITLTVGGRSRVPTTLIEGYIVPWDATSRTAFIRGDATGDGRLSIVDGVRIIHALLSSEDLDCEDALDVDDGGSLDLIDALTLLRFLFEGGTSLSIGICDRDVTLDSLGCSRSCEI